MNVHLKKVVKKKHQVEDVHPLGAKYFVIQKINKYSTERNPEDLILLCQNSGCYIFFLLETLLEKELEIGEEELSNNITWKSLHVARGRSTGPEDNLRDQWQGREMGEKYQFVFVCRARVRQRRDWIGKKSLFCGTARNGRANKSNK